MSRMVLDERLTFSFERQIRFKRGSQPPVAHCSTRIQQFVKRSTTQNLMFSLSLSLPVSFSMIGDCTEEGFQPGPVLRDSGTWSSLSTATPYRFSAAQITLKACGGCLFRGVSQDLEQQNRTKNESLRRPYGARTSQRLSGEFLHENHQESGRTAVAEGANWTSIFAKDPGKSARDLLDSSGHYWSVQPLF